MTAVAPVSRPAEAAGARPDATEPREPSRLSRVLQHGGWFVAPFLLLYGIFLIWPLVSGLWYSFTDTNLAGIDTDFIGLDNYREAFRDGEMWDAFGNTLKFTAMITPMVILTAFLLAMLAHNIRHGKWFWRLAFFAPFLLPSAVMSDLWKWLYEPDFGLLNNTLNHRVPWLIEADWAMFSVVLATLWWTVGFSFLLYLAALQSIPEHLYEAAALDGAGPLKRMWHITVPMVRNITGLLVILQILASLQVFDQIFLMTNGGPNGETTPVVQYVVQQGFTGYRIGYASAVSYIIFVLIVSVTLLRLLLARRNREGATQ
ncbi:ABC transporter permease subunit [Streptomyces sp. 3MP-14]|uniref:ABC transporter permease subunit n=1 Tax=Streptomyces mimosae TaxID=2586635 RepID=A0A5N6AS01_9ACTN|nr:MULTISPECIES: sugar ABC transporter permease [Streptomyces]KAB8170876.1 ABC transporter permease subunit [Streptomyces mimosae]KAB8179773.1 ABC transporter permease subunit [Streptomyces sp. 3MP-14]